ncbi:MAG: hypothetical protein N4A33_09905 [Bacteriovoracaceae bacterium]|jgi:hypothetical protein|nr:hypothetical protein [Bacteriovoracaceae bacterium]
MINIEILDSIDSNQIGIHNFDKNEITISNKKSDIIISKEACPIIVFKIINNNLFLINPLEQENLLVNQKYISSTHKLSPSDIITTDRLTIKVLHFKETIFQSRKELLNKRSLCLDKNNKELIELIERLKEK